MKPHPIPQMKHPRQRIRLLPTRSQPRPQLIVLILLHQRIEDLPTHTLRLRIRPHPQIQIIRTALNNHHHRPRRFHPPPASNHQTQHCNKHHNQLCHKCRLAPSLCTVKNSRHLDRSAAEWRDPRIRLSSSPGTTSSVATFPNTTALFAPVAAGTFPGNPFQLNHASSANATASFACAGTPSSSINRTFTPSGSNPSSQHPHQHVDSSPHPPPPQTPPATAEPPAPHAPTQTAGKHPAIEAAVKAVAVATTSSSRSSRPPAFRHIAINRETNASPNCSRPHDFGGRAEK